jgi:class 3 adenylate cyclase
MSHYDCTVLFADVSGSTRLFEGQGDESARRIIRHALYGCAHVIADQGGQVVKTIGDEVMATFADASCAMQAAIDMQRWAVNDSVMCEQAIGLRVGLHHGRVLAEERDVFGRTVNTAARLVALAGSAQVVTSAETVDVLHASLRDRCRELGTTQIPGREAALDIVSVIWEKDTSHLTVVPTVPTPVTHAVPRQILLSIAGRRYAASQEAPALTLGRGRDCSVVVEEDCVSRHHARIEFRHGFFVLVDQSTNGTWLSVPGQLPVFVHRGELPLLRDGKLGLGRRPSRTGGSTLAFQLETLASASSA